MLYTYTAKYTKIKSGYMGQLVEWPEVVTEGKTLEECRAMLQDALQEMVLAYIDSRKRKFPQAALCWSRSRFKSRYLSNAGIWSVISKRTLFLSFARARTIPFIRMAKRQSQLKDTRFLIG